MTTKVPLAIIFASLGSMVWIRLGWPELWSAWLPIGALLLTALLLTMWGKVESALGHGARWRAAQRLSCARDPWRTYEGPPCKREDGL